MIRQTVPFFGVSSMADSLSHYVDHLGFTLNPHLGAGWPDPLVLAAARGRGVKLKSTPLSYAARYGHEKLAAFLIERGASPQLPDDEAWGTPIAWAEKQGHGAIAELLRRRMEECSGDRDG